MIYVEENNKVILLNYMTNEAKLIYTHKQPIMAINIFVSEDLQRNNENNEEHILLQIEDNTDKKQQSNKEQNPLVNNEYNKLNYLTIFSIDYNGNLMVFKNGLILHNFNVLRLIVL